MSSGGGGGAWKVVTRNPKWVVKSECRQSIGRIASMVALPMALRAAILLKVPNILLKHSRMLKVKPTKEEEEDEEMEVEMVKEEDGVEKEEKEKEMEMVKEEEKEKVKGHEMEIVEQEKERKMIKEMVEEGKEIEMVEEERVKEKVKKKWEEEEWEGDEKVQEKQKEKEVEDLEHEELVRKEKEKEMMSSHEIIKHIEGAAVNATNLERIMRLLTSHGVFAQKCVKGGSHTSPSMVVEETKYGLTPISELLLVEEPHQHKNGESLAPLVLMNTDEVFLKPWLHLHKAVTNGDNPFTIAHGKSAFEYGREDPRFDALFNSAMASSSKITMQAILDEYDGFHQVATTLVDVGGGTGSSLRLILEKHPHIHGINFDQPHVVSQAPPFPGMSHVGGDMFKSVPSGDCIFMKWILHDWDDERCLQLLRNCYKALPEGGKLVIADAMIPIGDVRSQEARYAFTVDLLMMNYNLGGKERTELEFRNLVFVAGFKNLDLVLSVDFLAIMEAFK